MTRQEPTEYYKKNWMDLYLDAIGQLSIHDAMEKVDPSSSLRLSCCRCSILSSAISLEAAANCCLWQLDFSDRFGSECDKMDFIAKFSLFLKIKFGKDLDLSNQIVGRIAEIKQLRNDYVHPKVVEGKWRKVSENTMEAVPNGKTEYGLVDLSRDPGAWWLPDAVSILKHVTDFYNYYFMDTCGMDPGATTFVLIGDRDTDRDSKHGWVWNAYYPMNEAYEKYGINPRFIGYSPPGLA